MECCGIAQRASGARIELVLAEQGPLKSDVPIESDGSPQAAALAAPQRTGRTERPTASIAAGRLALFGVAG